MGAKRIARRETSVRAMAVILMMTAVAADDATVYRSVGPDGQTVYSDTLFADAR
jgi:hypothetical protein